MSNVGYRVFEDIERPQKELIQGFAGIQTANVGDCMNKMAAIHPAISKVNKQNLLGPAYTVKVPSGDNLLIFLAIEKAMPGDILVIDGEGSMDRALVGEVLSKFAQSKKIGGFLIDGCIRDYEILSQLDLPIFAKGRTPNGPFRNGPGELNVPVSIGGKVIRPGDIIIGDDDGVIVVKPEDAKEVQQKALELQNREAAILEKIEKGQGLNLNWVYEKLKQDHCDFIKKECIKIP
jgi:RraA family protein